ITMQEKSRSILRRFVPAVLLGRNGHRQVVRHGHHLPRPATAKGGRLSPRTKYSTVLDRSRAQEPDRQCAARFGDLPKHALGQASLPLDTPRRLHEREWDHSALGYTPPAPLG